MLSRPDPVEAIALPPDDPPRPFTWRGHRFAVTRGKGPEPLQGEWWRDGAVEGEQPYTVRDYYRVEPATGGRYWLFRLGDGVSPAAGAMSWFIYRALAGPAADLRQTSSTTPSRLGRPVALARTNRAKSSDVNLLIAFAS